ncbi:MAG: hypothetical protein M3416_01375 [Acidobacteriota bacterium]|nr:hypothetical protein [Acidobacteriota bacterium]
MSLIEVHPDLAETNRQLKRIADLLEAFVAPQLAPPGEYDKPKKGREAIVPAKRKDADNSQAAEKAGA